MFKIVECRVRLAYLPFENLRYRDKTVLVLLRNVSGKYILGEKMGFYPEGIVRMIGGGVDDGEDVLAAAARETEEEVGIKVEQDDFVPLIQVNVEGQYTKEDFSHIVYIYFLPVKNQEFTSGDDVSGLAMLDEKEYRSLIRRYYSLADDHYFEYPGGKFSWGDYGKVYGFIHQASLDEVLIRRL